MQENLYSIGKIAKMFDIPISTLRYYDKEGLFPDLDRTASGVRKFNENTIEALRVIECLKKSGMEIRDIKEFMQWCKEGPSTYALRRQMFSRQKEHIESQIKHLQQALDMITYKCWYYDEAIRAGNEEHLQKIQPSDMPEHIRQAFENAHQNT